MADIPYDVKRFIDATEICISAVVLFYGYYSWLYTSRVSRHTKPESQWRGVVESHDKSYIKHLIPKEDIQRAITNHIKHSKILKDSVKGVEWATKYFKLFSFVLGVFIILKKALYFFIN